MADYSNLKQKAQEVRNETKVGANTADRVGYVLEETVKAVEAEEQRARQAESQAQSKLNLYHENGTEAASIGVLDRVQIQGKTADNGKIVDLYISAEDLLALLQVTKGNEYASSIKINGKSIEINVPESVTITAPDGLLLNEGKVALESDLAGKQDTLSLYTERTVTLDGKEESRAAITSDVIKLQIATNNATKISCSENEVAATFSGDTAFGEAKMNGDGVFLQSVGMDSGNASSVFLQPDGAIELNGKVSIVGENGVEDVGRTITNLDEGLNKSRIDIGFIITGEYVAYDTFYVGDIPTGVSIQNRGVPIIVFDKDKANRIDVKTNERKEIVFDAYTIQTAGEAGYVEIEFFGIKESIESIKSLMRKGHEVVAKAGLRYNDSLVLAKGLSAGDRIQIKIVSATEDTGLYIQAYDTSGELVRLISNAQIGAAYDFLIEKNLKNVFISNLSSSKANIDIYTEISYGLDHYITSNKAGIAANKAKIGYSITGYNNSYSIFATGISIPIGTEIINKGVPAICFNEDKTLRLDLRSNHYAVSAFEITHIQGTDESGQFHLEVMGLSQVLDECERKVGVKKTINVNEELATRNPIYTGSLPKGTTLKLKVTPSGENPGRITLYSTDNSISDRLYDSTMIAYGKEAFVTLDRDIESIKIFSLDFQPFVIEMVAFGDILISGDNIDKKSITEEHLSEALQNMINSAQKETLKFNSFRKRGQVNGGGNLTLPRNHIGKNYILSGRFNNMFNSISIGVGYSSNATYKNRDYAACWVEIDNVNIRQYRYYNGAEYVLIDTKEHGITITDTMVIVIEAEVEKSVLRMYNNVGDIYEQDIELGCGTPFLYNSGTSAIDVELSFFPKDLTAKIWAFGDSYFSFTAIERWPYYLAKNGNINWLSNNQPGLSPENAYNDLVNLLSLNYIPQYVVWCLGMNGDTSETIDSEGNYVINNYQKTNIDKVFNLCKNYGIELILATVPTVPTRQKTGYCNYVKSLGVRYIDFAKSVGATSQGAWNIGLLSADGVHPSARGAAVLASQVLIDVPELTTKVY